MLISINADEQSFAHEPRIRSAPGQIPLREPAAK
jgi:hypothetical protein